MSDEAKVQAIRGVPAPTDVENVKRLRGVAQYMSSFLSDLAGALEPICALKTRMKRFCFITFAQIRLKINLSECAYF